jgi:protein involved in polysaccharide export with SLBB domain
MLDGCLHREHPQNSTPVPLDGLHDDAVRRVYVGREVRAPGYYLWTNGMRLKDAVLLAGGLTVFATNRAYVDLRRADGTSIHDRIRNQKFPDWVLRPGDEIHIVTGIF